MRPDEHKQKKNALYKKKHGMPKDKRTEGKGGTEDKSQDKRSASNVQKKNSDSKISTGATSHFSKSKSDSSSSSSDSECDKKNVPIKKKVFQRRQITSNWQKYDLTPDIEDDCNGSGGRDYQELLNLSASGEAMSHFRFTDELEWDERDTAVPDATDAYSTVLSLNSADITESLACLPLHTVLGLSQNLFTSEELAESVKKANENLTEYNKSSSRNNSGQANTQQQELNIYVDEPLDNVCRDIPVEKSALSFSLKKAEKQTECVSIDNESGNVSKLSDKNKIDTEPSITNSKQQEKSKTISESELDSLLDMDTPECGDAPTICVSTDESKDEENHDKKSTESIQQKAVNDVKSPPSQIITEVSSKESKRPILPDTTESDQLEDWLDSILDD